MAFHEGEVRALSGHGLETGIRPAMGLSGRRPPFGCEARYKIGDVARLTGVRTDTIRAWERRYHIVTPLRDVKQRREYTTEHVQRLLLVKRLVDAGHAISRISRLDDVSMYERAIGLRGDWHTATHWIVFSRRQPGWLREGIAEKTTCKVTWLSELPDLGPCQPDADSVLVIDMPSLSFEHGEEVLNVVPAEMASRCLVVYQYAPRMLLRDLSRLGFKLLKGPVAPPALVNYLS